LQRFELNSHRQSLGKAKPNLAAILTNLSMTASGCHFHPRCPQAHARCRSEYPAETRLSPTRTVRCHLFSG